MKSTVEAQGFFPAGIYAVGANFMRASRLHECSAAISLIEELRQKGEPCDLPKVAAVLFAGRVNVARRILQPLINSGLVMIEGNEGLSVCNDAYVREASLSLTQLKFQSPERGYKLVLKAEEVPELSAPLALAFLVVEELPKGLSSERFSRLRGTRSPISEAVACVSAKKKGSYILRTDETSESVICRHDRSGELYLKYNFEQEQIDGRFQPGKLTISLEGNDLSENHWKWLVKPLKRLCKGKKEWHISISTPANQDVFDALLKIKGLMRSNVPGYLTYAPGFLHRLKALQPGSSDDDNFAVRFTGFEPIPMSSEEALKAALNKLVAEAETGRITSSCPLEFAASFCQKFGYEIGITYAEMDELLGVASANMSGAGLARLFAASDWKISR
jgi:hypothetical protein